MNSKINYAWLAIGAIFVVLGLSDMISRPGFGPLLTIAIGGLVTYSSVHNLGGWTTIKWQFWAWARKLGK